MNSKDQLTMKTIFTKKRKKILCSYINFVYDQFRSLQSSVKKIGSGDHTMA